MATLALTGKGAGPPQDVDPQAPEGHGDGEDSADPAEHREAVASARTNADAIRHALIANPGADDSAIVTWLAQFGREVNRGQVYKVKRQAVKRQVA
ncbi:hypothetical protein ACFXKF_36540 [Streptomyces scopuliridis]|uniref:hypothetical protein n=1 Tax=Streptomyces scopuliridis TaxID=452529 RepID=UPI0036ADA6FF